VGNVPPVFAAFGQTVYPDPAALHLVGNRPRLGILAARNRLPPGRVIRPDVRGRSIDAQRASRTIDSARTTRTISGQRGGRVITADFTARTMGEQHCQVVQPHSTSVRLMGNAPTVIAA
jgi:hypothetical protein